jgi:hypothetical protein
LKIDLIIVLVFRVHLGDVDVPLEICSILWV